MVTQLNLAFSVGLVSRFASNPKEVHVKKVKRILHYNQHRLNIWRERKPTTCWFCRCQLCWLYFDKTFNIGIRLSLQTSNIWFGDQEARVHGTLDHNSQVHLDVYSNKGSCMARRSLRFGVQEMLILIYQDIQSTIALEKREHTSQRTKNIGVHFYYTKDKIANKKIQIEYCPTNKMIIDDLTKALAIELLLWLWDWIMTPKNIADALGKSVCAMMWKRSMRHHLVGANGAANKNNINKRVNGASISLLSSSISTKTVGK